MVRWIFALGTALVAASASANPVARRGRGEVPPAVPPLGDPVVIPGAYIAELADEDTSRFLDHVENRAGLGNVTERFRFSSRAFQGVSFHLDGLEGSEDSVEARLRRISELPQVKNLWPVTMVPMPKPAVHWTAAGTPLADVHRRAAAGVRESYAPHVQTQVDRLLAEGFTGEGLRIGIVDTGVDYAHTALGGCFGPGCLVEYGADLVGDDYDGTNTPVPDADPMDSCVGHGTHVAGIIAARENPLGFRGAAPGAKLGMYRIFGCTGGSSSDVILQATLRAFEDGSDIITGSIGRAAAAWANDPMSLAVSRIVEQGVPCTFAMGNQVGGAEGIFGVSAPASGPGVMGITSFENSDTPTYDSDTGRYSSVPNTASGGLLSAFVLWGSTLELTMKPQFGAPGGNIISTLPVSMGSYGVLSGTSMATPLAASIVALIMEARGTRDSALITRLLSATAKPNRGLELNEQTSGFSPVPKQGAGIVQAYDAVHATALLSVPALELMDKARLKPDVSFTVTNLGSSAVTYNLSHAPALTASTLIPVYRSSSPDLYPYYATLKFQAQSVTVEPNSSAEVHLAVSPPTQLADNLLPFYSGWVVLNGTDAAGGRASSLSLPYFGTTASMVDMKVLASDRIYLSRSDDPRFPRIADGTTFQLPAPANHSEMAQPALNGSATTLPAGVMPATWTWIVLGSKEVRIEAVPVATAAAGTTAKDNGLGMLTLGGIAGYPRLYNGPRGWMGNWDGQLADGTFAPAGRYSLVTLALRINGDRDKLADYDRFDSVEFNIRYV